MCNITRRKRSWRTVIKVHRCASTMQYSSTSFSCNFDEVVCHDKTLLFGVTRFELLGILNNVWVVILLEINL
jgi:hypothetical protein